MNATLCVCIQCVGTITIFFVVVLFLISLNLKRFVKEGGLDEKGVVFNALHSEMVFEMSNTFC